MVKNQGSKVDQSMIYGKYPPCETTLIVRDTPTVIEHSTIPRGHRHVIIRTLDIWFRRLELTPGTLLPKEGVCTCTYIDKTYSREMIPNVSMMMETVDFNDCLREILQEAYF